MSLYSPTYMRFVILFLEDTMRLQRQERFSPLFTYYMGHCMADLLQEPATSSCSIVRSAGLI